MYRFEGDCVLDGADSVVYDDIEPRAGRIIVDLLNERVPVGTKQPDLLHTPRCQRCGEHMTPRFVGARLVA